MIRVHCDEFIESGEFENHEYFLTLLLISGVGVSCIAVSDSRSGPLAVAGGDQLRIYLPSE